MLNPYRCSPPRLVMQDQPVLSIIDTRKGKFKRKLIAELYRSESHTMAQLAGLIHSSIPSATALVDELTASRWVRSIGTGTAQFGRKPLLFALDPTRYVTVVVDSSVHDTKLIAFTLANDVLHRVDLDLPLANSPAYLAALRKPLTRMARQFRMDGFNVIGVGAALPGLVNSQLGLDFTYPELNRPGQSLISLFESQFDAPVYLINDTKAIILGEHRFGLAQEKKHAMSINIDWGIGLAVIVNGEILQGTSGFAGELGHVQVRADGERCHCGKVGCLDTLASASALIRRARAGLARGQVSQLGELAPEAITIEHIIRQANAGDAFCIDLLNDVGSELGRGLSTAVHLFNPELIIVNGVLANAAQAITRPIERAIATYCLSNYRDNLAIELSELGEMAKLYGTHAYVIQNLLEHEQIP